MGVVFGSYILSFVSIKIVFAFDSILAGIENIIIILVSFDNNIFRLFDTNFHIFL